MRELQSKISGSFFYETVQ